jgi:hypothetical protein
MSFLVQTNARVEKRYFRVRVKRIKNGARSVVTQLDRRTHRSMRYEARRLQRVLRWLIDKSIYGFVRGRGLHRLLLKVIEWRKRGFYILKLDIKKAYRNADLLRLEKLLRKSKVRGPANYLFFTQSWRHLRIVGLAEGLHTSPVFLALYMTPVVRRIKKQYEAAIYGDDIFLALKSETDLAAALAVVKNALQKNQYKKRGMEMHETGIKGFKLYSPHSVFQFGGVEFTDGVGILPQRGKSALHYVRTLAKIRRYPQMGNALVDLGHWIDSICPASYLRRSEEEWRTAYEEPDSFPTEDSTHQGVEGGKSGLDLSALAEETSKISTHCTPTYSTKSVGMEPAGTIDTADFGSFTGCVTFSGTVDWIRGTILLRLNEDATLLNRLYQRQLKAESAPVRFGSSGEIQKLRHPFWDFVEELNTRFIQFNLNAPQCLTYALAPSQHAIASSGERWLRALYREELEVINNDLFDILKYSVSKSYRNDLMIKRAKIQQFLRGYCHLRMIEVCYGKIPNIPPAAVKAIGTLVFPIWEVGAIKTVIDSWSLNVINTTQFQQVIQSMNMRMKNQDVFDVTTIISSISRVPYQTLDRMLWAFRSSGGKNAKA